MKTETYSFRWKGESKDASESMPVGGRDVGGNIWVEDHQIFFYLQQSGWFDENNSLLKAGRFRIQVEPNPFLNGMEQELVTEDGYVCISGDGFQMRIWASIIQSVVHLEYESKIPRTISIQYESWRYEDREVDSRSYELFQCKEVFFYPLGNPTFFKDQFEAGNDSFFFWHQNRNEELSMKKEFRDQGLEEWYESAYNPQKNLVFGGMLVGENLEYTGVGEGVYQDTPFRSYRYRTTQEMMRGTIRIALASVYGTDKEELRQELTRLHEDARTYRDTDFQQHREWWNSYFRRSFIKGSNDDDYTEIMRNYQLFRYMLGCNYYGFWPTKFNGGLFTFDPGLVGKTPWKDEILRYTPDYRLWGGGSHTIQNQRLVYWPMLKTGDAKVMRQHFDFFVRILETAKKRCESLMHVSGAMFPEQVGTYGLCCGCDNEWGNRTGLPVSQIKYHFSNSLETALMILEYYRFTGEDISGYMDLIDSILQFYDTFYPENDENGKMVLYPGNALETYHVVKNPIDAIAGLHCVLDRLLDLPEYLADSGKKGWYKRLKDRVPEWKTRWKDGHEILAYADHPSIIHNCEIPELYTVFPYGQFGIGKENLELARDTARYAWESEEQLTHISWHPTGIQYAQLGMLAECEEFLKKKLSNGNHRFPAFWGPGHDWTPDHNWGGSGMIQLQEMLLQTSGREIRILPCWNPKIDVHFRLMAPDQTVVECKYQNGKIRELQIIPKERERDVIFPEWHSIND